MFKDGFLIGEIASGKLIRKPSGYYIQILMYVAKEDNFLSIHQVETKGVIAPDFGVKSPVVK